jgi:hypothetical protein
MSYVGGRRSAAPRSAQAEGGIPASWVPEWVQDLGLALIIPLGILAAASAILGEKFGAGDGWSMFGSVAAARRCDHLRSSSAILSNNVRSPETAINLAYGALASLGRGIAIMLAEH